MPAVEKPILQAAITAKLASEKTALLTALKEALKAKEKEAYGPAIERLVEKFDLYETALLGEIVNQVDAYIVAYMTRLYSTHMHMTTAPGGPTLIPLIPAD